MRAPRTSYVGAPLLAVVVDDVGWNLRESRRLAGVDLPLTWAIIPWLRASGSSAGVARERGIPFLIHLPMQSLSDAPDDRSQFVVGVSDDELAIRHRVRAAVAALPGAVGLNNHRGSRATSDRRVMDIVADELADANLCFLDSRTIGRSCAYAAAVARGVPALRNDRFLDNRADAGAIQASFDRAVRLARKRGYALVIGHIRPVTLDFFEELAKSPPEGIRLVTVPEMLEALRERGERE